MKIKPLTPEKEKQRSKMNMNKLEIGQLVIDAEIGDYVWIRGFETPWIWILEPLDGDASYGANSDKYDNKYYTIHFTDLVPIAGKDLYKQWKDGQKMTADACRIAELAKISLMKYAS